MWLSERISVKVGRICGSRSRRNYLSMGNDDPCLVRIYYRPSSDGTFLVWIHYTSNNSAASCSHYHLDGSPRRQVLDLDPSSSSGKTTKGAWKILCCRISAIQPREDPLQKKFEISKSVENGKNARKGRISWDIEPSLFDFENLPSARGPHTTKT